MSAGSCIISTPPAIPLHGQPPSALGIEHEQEQLMTTASHDGYIARSPSDTGLLFRSGITDSLIDTVLWNESSEILYEDVSILSSSGSDVSFLLLRALQSVRILCC